MNRTGRRTVRLTSILAVLGAVPGLAGCDYLPGYYAYRAEVGYHDGPQDAWYVGQSTSYDACISEATSYFNRMNAATPTRAFSWACRKMRGEEFLGRVR